MTLKDFEKKLTALIGDTVIVSESNYDEGVVPPAPCAMIVFCHGVSLRADYWRIIKNGKAIGSSFDHLQKYGLPEPIDAHKVLQEQVKNAAVIEAKLDKETGDLVFEFNNGIKLQVMNLTGYEVWEIRFPDGLEEFSNYLYRL